MSDISGQGLEILLKASKTFPAGFRINQFADDADPLEMASIQLADKAMGLNGDLIVWSKAVPIPMAINIIPASDDDENLTILAEANRVGKGKRSAKDIITAIISYSDGETTTCTVGKITDAMVSNSVGSSGRLKTKAYVFAFENKVSANNAASILASVI